MMYEPDVTVFNKSMLNLHTFSHVSVPFNPEDVSLDPQTPTEVQAIMKSREGVKHLLPVIGEGKGQLLSCKDINKVDI